MVFLGGRGGINLSYIAQGNSSKVLTVNIPPSELK